jgi:prepilin-type N-terminal cleavage/methylation domain-containing protein
MKHRRRPGFTLPELLIATVLACLLMAALVAVVVGHVRSRGRMEAVMKLQDDWTRVQFLLDQDIEESIASSNASGCAASGTRLTLTVAGTNQPITYYLDGTNLRRCGPTITVTGELSPTLTSDDLVAERVTSFEVDLSDPQRPFYTLTLTDPTGVVYTNGTQPTGAMMRSRRITN